MLFRGNKGKPGGAPDLIHFSLAVFTVGLNILRKALRTKKANSELT